jgi:hypothetical protein
MTMTALHNHHTRPRPYPSAPETSVAEDLLEQFFNAAYRHTVAQRDTTVVRYHHDRDIRLNFLLYPHTPQGIAATEYGRAREQREAIPKQHLPQWRLRFAIALGMFPLLWILPRCRHKDCRKRWPCPPLLLHLRHTHGWTADLDPLLQRLSTKKRRAEAARRNPTAVSHRAGRPISPR